MISEKTLVLFTKEFPYGNKETFLETEIQYLSGFFERIYVIPDNIPAPLSSVRKLPSNIYVKSIFSNKEINYLFVFIKNFKKVMYIFLFSFFREKKKYLYLFHSLSYCKYLINQIWKAKEIDTFIKNNNLQNAKFYTYWFLINNLALAILSEKKVIQGSISRAHRYDLYDECQGGLMPFRPYKMQHLKKIFTVSRSGCEYLKSKVGNSEKIDYSYLGTKDFGINPFVPNEAFVIVSCSNIIPVKRVDLIAHSLSYLDFPLKWIHFGDGSEFGRLTTLGKSLPSNIEYEFKGSIRNRELMDFYTVHPVNLFINLSTSEGLPVSIMEVISFGIPVLATNVGGVGEIVTYKSGILVNKNTEAERVAKEIKTFKISKRNTLKFRMQVRAFWKSKFDADFNYADFIKKIK